MMRFLSDPFVEHPEIVNLAPRLSEHEIYDQDVVKRTLYELASAKSCVASSRIPRCQ
jgi:hypothetical protein